jgi:hypothetical protein
MLKKIISGGQTGADQAALDAAIELGMPYGGWVPKGRKTEIGPLPLKYCLQEMNSARYSKRTRQNVIDSEGTVIFSHGKLEGGSKYTRKAAKKHVRPWLAVDFNLLPSFEIIVNLHQWVSENDISILNVAGARAKKDSKIYSAVKFIMTCIILLEGLDSIRLQEQKNEETTKNSSLRVWAKTLDEAANRLISELPMMDRIIISNMEVEDLDPVHLAFAEFVKNRFLFEHTSELLISCQQEAGREDLSPENEVTLIIHRVWEKLRADNELRLMR